MPVLQGPIGIAAVSASMSGCLSTMPLALRMRRSGSVGAYPFTPILAVAANALASLAYGIVIGDPVSMTSSTFGSCVGSFYMFTYLRCKLPPATRREHHLRALALAVLGATGLVAAFSEHPLVTGLVGLWMNVAAIAMYAAPLVQLQAIIKAKELVGISLPVCCSNFVTGLVWTMHSLNVGAATLVVPNLIGLLSALAQLALFLIYPMPSGDAQPSLGSGGGGDGGGVSRGDSTSFPRQGHGHASPLAADDSGAYNALRSV